MNNIAKSLGKKSFLTALILDFIGILFSSLVNINLTNTVLNRIIYFSYCIRFELAIILLLLFLIYIVYYIIKNKLYSPLKLLVLSLPIILSFILSRGNIIDATDYYDPIYNNNIYSDESYSNYIGDDEETLDQSIGVFDIEEEKDEIVNNEFVTNPIFKSLLLETDKNKQYPLFKFFVARYFYFHNKFYEVESQYHFIKRANENIVNLNWDKCVYYYHLAQDLYPNITNTEIIKNRVEQCEEIESFCNILFEQYIKPIDADNGIPFYSFVSLRTLSNLWPQKFSSQYNEYKTSVENAINQYGLLYRSYNKQDYDACQELLQKYGWVWFDSEFLRLLTNKHNKKSDIMEWLGKYLSGENVSEAQTRLRLVWLEENKN